MTGGASAVITLTDGSITYKLGNAAHLSTAEKTSGGPMDGTQDAEASVDSFNGFSVGLGVGPASRMSLDTSQSSCRGLGPGSISF